MENWRQIAHDAKDILTVCLAKAIDGAMTARCGSQWFAAFCENDVHEKVSNRITKTGQLSVRDLDLQALLKFLRHRSAMTEQVLAHYGFFDGLDSFAKEQQLRQLSGLLDRLMNDFRNRIEAHSRAADIEKELSGEGWNRIYGYEEAVQDMYKLASIFSTVTDGNGVAYCKRIADLTKKKKRPFVPIAIAVTAVVLVAGLIWGIVALTGDSNVYRNTPVMTQAQVTIQPVEIFYEGNELVAVCRILNGTGNSISGIHVSAFRVSCQGVSVANAAFGTLPNVTIAPGSTLDWVFRFPADTVAVKDGQLANAVCSVEFQYQ